MKAQVLEDIGLGKNEAKVYLALVELGNSVAGAIAENSKVHRTNVYDAIESLIQKGLVTYIFRSNKKFFTAADPTRIKEILSEKVLNFENNLLPNLNSIKHKSSKPQSLIQIYEGIIGIKAITDDILKEKKEICTFGIPRDVSKKMSSFLSIYHKRRIKAKIWQKHIYNENAKDRILQLNKMTYTKASYLPKEYDSPATTTIYGDKVAFFIWSEKPFGILIEDKRMAKSYKNYFKILWDLSIKSNSISQRKVRV